VRPGPKINEPGRISLRGWLTVGPGSVTSASDSGIWFQNAFGLLTLAALEGSLAPDGLDTWGSLNYNPAWADDGSYAFPALLMLNHSGIVRGAAYSPTLTWVLKGNDPAPGLTAGETVSSLASPLLMNASGQLAIKMALKTGVAGVTTSTDGVILAGNPASGTFLPIAREGAAAPGAAGGKFSTLLGTDFLSIDHSGRVLFSAILASRTTAPVINTSNNTGIWQHDLASGTAVIVARGGSAAPGLSGPVYKAPAWGLISSGKVTFRTTLAGSGVTAGSNDVAILSGIPDLTLTALARTGVTSGAGVPAGLTGAAYAKLGYPRLSAGPGAEVAFRGELKVGAGPVTLTSHNEGIWKESGGAVRLLVREGDPAPGLPGIKLGALGEPVVGESGQVAFTARLVPSPTAVASTADSAWFCERTDGGIDLMLREGAVLASEAGPRTVADLLNIYAYPEEHRTMNIHGITCIQISCVGGQTAIVRFAAP
jgi:hypothetical protein